MLFLNKSLGRFVQHGFQTVSQLLRFRRSQRFDLTCLRIDLNVPPGNLHRYIFLSAFADAALVERGIEGLLFATCFERTVIAAPTTITAVRQIAMIAKRRLRTGAFAGCFLFRFFIGAP
jgi:hypothetical protein